MKKNEIVCYDNSALYRICQKNEFNLSFVKDNYGSFKTLIYLEAETINSSIYHEQYRM